MSVRGLNTKLFYLSQLQREAYWPKKLRDQEEKINKIEESGGINIRDFLIQKNPFPKN